MPQQPQAPPFTPGAKQTPTEVSLTMSNAPPASGTPQTFSASDVEPVTFSVNDIDQTPPAKDPQSLMDSLGRTLSTWWDEVDPVTQAKGLVGAASDLVGTAKNIGKKQAEPYERAKKSFAEGDYAGGAIHAVNWLIPLIGPQLDDAGQMGREGDMSGMVGKSLGIGTNLFVTPKVIGAGAKVLKNARTPSLTATTPEVAAAVKYGQAEGIPVDAATATGNPVVRAGQYLADRSMGGAIVGPGAERAQQTALATTADKLAQQVHPTPVTPEDAGVSVRTGLRSEMSGQQTAANDAYSRLRAIEAKTPSMVVDYTNLKRLLQPTRDLMNRLSSTQRANSPGFNTMERILAGPDQVPLSIADMDRSDLAQIAHEADPQMRSFGQGVAARTAGLMEKEIQTAVQQGGPDAVNALKEGRAATVEKYAARDAMQDFFGEDMKGEPVGAFRKAVTNGDANVERLERMQRKNPAAIPQLGRAFLNDLFNRPTKVQGIGSGADVWKGVYNDWQNMGPRTKALLFKDPVLRGNLDNFFLLAKKMADNPNPSGTGHLVSLSLQAQGGLGLLAMHPVAGIVDLATSLGGGYGLSRFLHSPAGVKLLTEGMTLPAKSPAAVASWWAKAQRVAGVLGQPGAVGVPATADQQNTTPTAP